MRTIQTIYYLIGAVVKINNAKYPTSAVLRAVDHMQQNHYGADTVEVFDAHTGTLYAVVTHSAVGVITIVYKREIAHV